MSNRCIVSEWFVKEERHALYRIVKPGDLLEFDRGNYCHWVVYMGHLPTEDPEDDELIVYEHMCVHMANPMAGETDDGGHGSRGGLSSSSSIAMALSSSSSSQSTASGDSITYEKVMDVWSRGPARINNGFDREMSPFGEEEILQRAYSSVGNPTGIQRLPYNVLTNNCEHFATYVRNGWGVSAQVGRGLRKALHVGSALALAFVPRPLLVAAGLTYFGYQAVTQSRRASATPAVVDLAGDGDEDNASAFDDIGDDRADAYNPD